MTPRRFRPDNFILDWDQIYRLCLCVWMFILTLDQTYVEVPAMLYRAIWMAIKGILVLKVLHCNRCIYSARTVLAGIMMILGLVATRQSQNYGLEAFFWFLAAADGIDVERTIRALFKMEIAVLLLVITCSLLGLIGTSTIYRDDGTYRYSLGFYHPNILACKVLQVNLMGLYLHRHSVRIWNLMIALMTGWIAYILTNSRTAWLLTILLVAMLMWNVLTAWVGIQSSLFARGCVYILQSMYIVCALISLMFALFYSYDTEGMDTIYSRFSQLYAYYHHYPIRLFGNVLYYHNGAGIDPNTGLYALDNTYMYLLLGFGILIYALFMIWNTMAMQDAARHGDIALLIIFVTYAVYGMAETYGIRFDCNFTLILLYPYVWGNITQHSEQGDYYETAR